VTKAVPDRRGLRRVFLLVSLSLSALHGVAAKADCRAASPPSLAVEIAAPPVIYRLNTSTDALAAAARGNGTPLGRGSRLLGLTVNQYDLQIVVDLDRERVADGTCAKLRHVAVTVASGPRVLVDGHFASGSCQQRAILDHESEHVTVFREAVAHYEPAMEEALREAGLPPALHVTAGQDPEREYAAMIERALSPVLDAARRRAQDANSRIDTAQHYAAVFRRCPSWE
jgi:hypothetical protein